MTTPTQGAAPRSRARARRRPLAFMLVAAAGIAVLAGSATPAETRPSVQIFSVAIDGSDVRVLGSAGHAASAPTAAPDGRIAFLRDPWGPKPELWVMNADGTGERRLVSGSRFENDHWPPLTWSPTGADIAAQFVGASGCEIGGHNCSSTSFGVLDAETGAVRATVASRGRGAGDPSWSPDGMRLVFAANLDEGLEGDTLEIARRDGGNRRVLVRADDLSDPEWSPRGAMIAYRRDGWIWTVPPDGRHPVRHVRGSLGGWTPAGNRLVYSPDRTEHRRVFLLDPVTGRSRRLVRARLRNFPTWSPDGRRIAYTASVGLRESVVVVIRVGDGRVLSTLRLHGAARPRFFDRSGRRLVCEVWRPA